MRRVIANVFLIVLAASVLASGPRFKVSFDDELVGGVFSGRVVVYLSKTAAPEPRFGPNWFNPQPMYSARFEGVEPWTPMIVQDSNAIGFPGRLADLTPGTYRAQAVMDRNLGGRAIGSSPGNLYSKVQEITIAAGETSEFEFKCDQMVAEQRFVETARVKEVRHESALLTRFYGRPTFLKAAISLPEGYDADPARRYPIFYEIPGFGGTHYGMSGRAGNPDNDRDGEPFIHVVLNPECPTGHHVFADSANNGPWGKALVTELIPEIERRFRAVGEPWARFVGGHSSGGWSSLWLQVTYPEVFGGVWSTAPDPVDFRAFQLVDIYQKDANLFSDKDGQPIPLARMGSRPAIFTKVFSDMERPIRGEQLGSFEAVFSPRGKDGDPARLWNRDTGEVDPTIAEAWRAYDIGHILRTRFDELYPKLKGKIHVYMGESDTFYLDGAVRLLQADMQAKGADFVIEMLPGDHGSLMTRDLLTRIDREVAAKYRAGKP
jgi:hypothetical protein